MKLAAVMIARNEAKGIGACLDSIRKGVDEIVIFDTGSTDDTVDIAKKHGADVVVSDSSLLVDLGEMVTLGDFAEARNRALSLASCEWAVIVDADWRAVWPTLEATREAIKSDKHNSYSSFIHHAANDSAKPVEVVTGKKRFGNPLVMLNVIRRGLGGPWYDGIIHETMGIWEEKHGLPRGIIRKSRWADYGTNPQHRDEAGKNRRNELLLERAVKVRPDDPVPKAYLALEYARAKPPHAAEFIEDAWKQCSHPRLGRGGMLLRLVVARTWFWLEHDRLDLAWETLDYWDAASGEPHPDILNLRGQVCDALGMKEHAKKFYAQANGPQEKQWTIRFLSPAS